jgi:heme-degrading monooxygenase HmoA
MTVLMTMDLPVDRKVVEEVSSGMRTHEDPPEGLIVHVATETANGVHVVDIWESKEAFEKFSADRLTPAMQKAMVELNIKMDGPPEQTFEEAFDVVRGR